MYGVIELVCCVGVVGVGCFVYDDVFVVLSGIDEVVVCFWLVGVLYYGVICVGSGYLGVYGILFEWCVVVFLCVG